MSCGRSYQKEVSEMAKVQLRPIAALSLLDVTPVFLFFIHCRIEEMETVQWWI
ncbi:MAG: hypothetical protein ACJAWN_001982 [Neolewinella sp.]|jgi:hypothetical protein